MTKKTATAVITILVLIVCGIYVYLTIRDGGATGSPAPLGLYIIYIAFFYRRRLGWLVAVVSWFLVDFFLLKPVGELHFSAAAIMLIGWFLLDVEVGNYAGKYKRWKDREIKKREIYSSVAAHELKTPLAVMKLRISMVQQKDPILADVLMREVDRLQSLIERMMDYSKISTGKYTLNYSIFSMDELVTEVVSNIQNVHTTARLRLHLPDHTIHIEADRGAVEQILINLITNAVKYCPKKQIDVTLKKRNAHWVQVIVKDKGDGIPEKTREKIFAPFVQGSNSAPGLGMGLYIVRKLVDLHKGLIYFHVDGGTTFFLELPQNPKVKDTRTKYRI